MIGSNMNILHSQHTFHIPVMGTGFTVDTPLRVARYGISSVISLVDDTLIEDMRRFYAAEYGETFTPIHKYDDDWRARRITEYLNLVDRIVKQQFEALRASEFEPGSEITKYFELLPDTSALKHLYLQMLSADQVEKKQMQTALREQILPGWINVNIMTKLDRVNVDEMCEPLSEMYSDALSGLRGYANSTLASGIVLWPGLIVVCLPTSVSFLISLRMRWGGSKSRLFSKLAIIDRLSFKENFLLKKGCGFLNTVWSPA